MSWHLQYWREENTGMACHSNPNRIKEIVCRRLHGEPVASIAADMGLSRTYIYNVLSRLPKTRELSKNEMRDQSIQPSEEIRLVMDYLEAYPTQKKVKEFGKDRIDEMLTEMVAEKHGLPVDQVLELLCRTTAHHPMVSHFPLYSSIERWKTDNLITMRELASSAGMSVQGMNQVLNGFRHMSLETARRIQKKSGLSLYEIYLDLLELDKERQNRDRQE